MSELVPKTEGSPQSAPGQAQAFTLTVAAADAGTRLDKYLTTCLPDLSRAQVQRLIQQGHVRLSAAVPEASLRVRPGEVITLSIPPPQPSHLRAENLALDIVYEDEALLVIDKPPGLVVHPAPGHASGTLVNALLFHCQTLSGIGGEERPGIVHRLDKDTSGLLLVAKHDRSHRHLAEQLKTRQLQRRYVALVRGQPRQRQGTIEAPIGRHPQQRQKMAVVASHGRAARTHYQVSETWGTVSLLHLALDSGRTHQIRVHLAHIGHAVLGDPLYGSGGLRWPGHAALEQAIGAFPRQALHAAHLRFQHPQSGAWCEFSAPLPADMATLLAHLRQT
jgi:23S rRNA pseudouridine1911/1915/1917 synthase